MKILFVDHETHRKTHSADFFLEILREHHEVELHYYSRYYDCGLTEAQVNSADVIVFWEFLPDRFRFAIPGKRCIFVPMYDNEWGSQWQWRRIARSGMSVISFCRAVSEHARRMGVKNILEARFAFDPAKYGDTVGEAGKALYWDRGYFSEAKIRSLFAPGAVDELVVQRNFLPDEEYRSFVSRFGVYITPRPSEGIGMAFLEQLARGNCVIAHDAPTMNEYIVNGVNGILRDFHSSAAKPITREEIAAVLANVRQSSAANFAVWQRDRGRITELFDEIGEMASVSKVGDFTDRMMFARYLLEGAVYRLMHG